jgi:hypothetical protein
MTHYDKIPAWAVGPMMEEHAKQKPLTAAGRALLEDFGVSNPATVPHFLAAILAIEAEATATIEQGADVADREAADPLHRDQASALAAPSPQEGLREALEGLDVEAAWAVGYYAGREDDEWQEPMDIERRAAEYARLRPHRPHIEALFASASERTEGGVA